MLQFSPTVYTITARLTSRLLWRLHTSLMSNTATVSNVNTKLQEIASNTVTNSVQPATFHQLKTKLCTHLDKKSLIASRIQDAEDVHDLLQVIKEPLLTQNQIIQALHTITLWINENNKGESRAASIHDLVESKKNIKTKMQNGSATDTVDLSQYHDLSTFQMIKEIKRLAIECKRDVKVLNYLYQNIVTHSLQLTPNLCVSLMYSMCKVSYSDERLLQKICNDIISHLNNQSKLIPPAMLASIIKSASIIRYKNDTLLHCVCHNIISSKDGCRYSYHHIATVLVSLAMLGYRSEILDEMIKLHVSQLSWQRIGHSDWLDVVWSLVVLEKAQLSHISTVLHEDFIKPLMFYDIKKKVTCQLKLLNIDSYARYALKGYNGPPITPTAVPHSVAVQSKQKKLYVKALEDTLANFLPSTSHYKLSTDTQMGFFLDATLHMDSNMTSMALTENIKEGFFKIGILLLDYYDMCLGSKQELGLIKLYTKLLTCRGYRVVCIRYQNFGVEDKVEKRVSYLKRQIWLTLNNENNI